LQLFYFIVSIPIRVCIQILSILINVIQPIYRTVFFHLNSKLHIFRAPLCPTVLITFVYSTAQLLKKIKKATKKKNIIIIIKCN